MKTRTNQPVFLDNGQPVDDSNLGGTKLYRHELTLSENAQFPSNASKVVFVLPFDTPITMDNMITLGVFPNGNGSIPNYPYVIDKKGGVMYLSGSDLLPYSIRLDYLNVTNNEVVPGTYTYPYLFGGDTVTPL